MKDQEQLKSLNQLLSLVIGGRIARQTEHLKSAPINRINHAQKIIADGELQEATRDLQDGSPQQQRSRKRSFEKNSKILNDLEKKLLVFKKILRGYQQ